MGYEVTVAADACPTATQQQHEASLNAMRVLAGIKTVAELPADFGAAKVE
ncbi:MAG: isochorismatase family protein [Gammaproteobacteria bacterium]|nr:isochorismatase family protein [Gammaproteobacteria bacterium]